MSNIRECSQISEDSGPSVYIINNYITKNTTPEDLDIKITEVAGYKFENGGRCGWNALGCAAYHGNLKLINHIVKKGGNHLLNLGNSNQWTPLYCAVNCADGKDGLLATKELIRLGADINIATESGRTPLWKAAEKGNIHLVKFLLNKGAIETSVPELSEIGKATIKTAKIQIERERSFLSAYFKFENNESIIQKLPYELARQIYEYIQINNLT